MRLKLNLLFLLVIAVNSFSEELPFSAKTISTDYGPRVHPTKHVWNFHHGIDYNPMQGDADKGLPVKAVESGVVKDIHYDESGGGWIITVRSQNNLWQYMHIFDNENLSSSGEFKLGMINDTIYIERNNVENWGRRTIKIKDTVVQGEPIAPVGTSGIGTGAHLHLGLNYGDDNPLVYLNHDMSDFKVIMENPKDNAVLKQSDLTESFPIKFKVDALQGKDLDKIDLFLDGQNLAAFSYGGKPGEDKKLMLESNEDTNGVKPVAGTFEDEFVFIHDFSNLKEGEHTIRITAKNINNKDYVSDHRFNIEKEDESSGSNIRWYKYDKYWIKGKWRLTSSVDLGGIAFGDPFEGYTQTTDIYTVSIALVIKEINVDGCSVKGSAKIHVEKTGAKNENSEMVTDVRIDFGDFDDGNNCYVIFDKSIIPGESEYQFCKVKSIGQDMISFEKKYKVNSEINTVDFQFEGKLKECAVDFEEWKKTKEYQNAVEEIRKLYGDSGEYMIKMMEQAKRAELEKNSWANFIQAVKTKINF
ncbi:MAG: M23 family metallopeptidase [Endomicrobiales bacterium]|nr:M23 family metallopeptidase [Endomicrobiales bacterium]